MFVKNIGIHIVTGPMARKQALHNDFMSLGGGFRGMSNINMKHPRYYILRNVFNNQLWENYSNPQRIIIFRHENTCHVILTAL